MDFRNQDRKVLYTCAYPLCPVEFIKLNIFKRIVIFIIYHFNTMKHPLYPQDFTNKSVFTCTSSFGAICFIFFHSKKYKFWLYINFAIKWYLGIKYSGNICFVLIKVSLAFFYSRWFRKTEQFLYLRLLI